MPAYSPGIRDKLIGIFVLIKVLPLIVLAWFAWNEISRLAEDIEAHVAKMSQASQDIVTKVGGLSSENSIKALDAKSRETIERLTTDTARSVAAFLYDRDRDIVFAAHLSPDRELYRQFVDTRMRAVTVHAPWKLNTEGTAWVSDESSSSDGLDLRNRTANNKDNAKAFHYRPPDPVRNHVMRPLYLEMTFLDLTGQETIKYSASPIMSQELNDVSDPANTYCRAETYFEELKTLKPGDIYVSDVIGPYVPSNIIGPYTPQRAASRNVDFKPEEAGYAGKENPVGKRFKGLVRWATPVVLNGSVTGYVTLALDHTHIMEFTDHIVPTDERYTDISDAASGNYAFMWDYMGRNISHPRDYFITGYDPETGDIAVPWLAADDYEAWQASGLPISAFLETQPTFSNQALSVSPSKALVGQGFVGLDCRYLNFAPQCEGWYNLTEKGGSGSFVIFWSGLLKLTTAGTIPYYTGRYGTHPRGFGFVTIGANVDEFHRPAVSTAKEIKRIETEYLENMGRENIANRKQITESLSNTATRLTVYTLVMVAAVILIAIVMASALTSKITTMSDGLMRFQDGEMDYRMSIRSNDEIGQVVRSFNQMADSIQKSMGELTASREALETSNRSLQAEIDERIAMEKELNVHKTQLEKLVEQRTLEIKTRMDDLRKAEAALRKSEETFSTLFMVSPVWISLNRMHDGLFLNANEAFTRVTGHSREKALTSTVRALNLWTSDESRRRAYAKLVKERHLTLYEERFRMKNGEIRDFLWSASTAEIDGEDCAINVFLDITELRQHEREMNRLRAVLYSIINSLPSMIIGLDVSHRITLWNREAESVSGVRAEEAEGHLVYNVVPWLEPHRVMIGEAVEQGRIHRKERCQTDYWNDSHYLDILVCPLEGKGANGAVVRIETVTQRVRLEQRMIQTEKMQSIGSLAAGMAHEINNPLAGILQNVQVISNRLQADLPVNHAVAEELGITLAAIQAYMEKRNIFNMMNSILEAGSRAADIVDNMLSFSRKSDSDYSRYNIAEILDKTLEIIQNDYDLKKKFDFRNILIKKDYSDDVPPVMCDRTKLQQVFFNILENGAQAMMGDEKTGEAPCFTLRHYREDNRVCIEIADNGPGMDEAVRARVFEPFFTTKPVGLGTGLGLYICWFIIAEDHKGSLSVDAQPGKGARFIIRLPV